MTLSDVEKYLVKYPLWKEQKDLGMSGSLHTYEVTLAKENIIAMISEFSREATGKDMTPEARKDIDTSLADVEMSGVLSLDPEDKKRVVFDGVLLSGSGIPIRMMLDETPGSTLLSISASGNALNISHQKIATGYETSLTLIQDGSEVARLESTIKKDDTNIRSIDMTFSAPAQGLTVTMENRSNPDGTFEGKLNAGIGNMTWKGKIDTNAGISDLHIT